MNHSEVEIIDKWLANPSFVNWINKSNDTDIAKWEAYFQTHPDHIELAEVAKFSLELDAKPTEVDKVKSMASLSALQNRLATTKTQPIRRERRMSHIKIWQVAASMLLLVGCLWAYTSMNSNGEQITLATQEEQMEHILTDGTKVVLNKHASLSYFSKDVRNVILDGEAYFEVTKQPDTNAPFQVKTDDLTVTVLGTAFNVNNEFGQTSVYLDEGKVRLNLGDDTNEIDMVPGDLYSYSKRKNKVIENRKANALAQTAWKEKVILFEEASLDEVLKTVSLIYDVRLVPNLSDKGRSFTGGIPVNDLDVALTTIKEVYQLDIKKIEEQYIIK